MNHCKIWTKKQRGSKVIKTIGEQRLWLRLVEAKMKKTFKSS